MSAEICEEPQVAWTWADLLSSYRYWGLFAAFVLSQAAAQLYYNFAHLRSLQVDSASLAQIHFMARICWVLLAPLCVWMTVRSQPIRILMLVAGLAVAAVMAFMVPAIPVSFSIAVTALFIPLMSATFLIGLPVLLTGAQGGRQPVLIGFGVAWVCGMLLGGGLSAVTGALIATHGLRFLNLELLTLLVLALMALLPVGWEPLTMHLPEPDPALLGTRQYWGLFVAFVLSEAATQIYYNVAPSRRGELNFESLAPIHSMAGIGWVLLAPLVVWIATRTEATRVLVLVAALAATSSVAFLIPGISVHAFLVPAALLIPLMSATLLIWLPVLLADRHDGGHSVLVGFCLAWMCGILLAMGLSELTGALNPTFGSTFSNWALPILLGLAVIALLSTRWAPIATHSLRRRHSFAPVNRNPVVTAALSLLGPLYLVYWNYRIHGEEAWVRGSRRLLSPRAAAWLAAIPVLNAVLFPIMMSSLADHHNEVAAASGAGPVQRPWVVFLWSVFFWPVAVWMVQEKLNMVAALRSPSRVKKSDARKIKRIPADFFRPFGDEFTAEPEEEAAYRR